MYHSRQSIPACWNLSRPASYNRLYSIQCLYFYLQVSFFLACPVLGSGIILLCQPAPQPQVRVHLV